MADILYYLLKVSVGTTVFYITYHFLFRKSKHYVFNRLYLIGSFIASFIIPSITFKTEKYVTATSSSLTDEAAAFSESFAFASESGGSLSIYNYFLIIYLLGIVFFISKLVYSCIAAAHIKKSSQIEQIQGLNIYITEDNIRAFTFLDKIIIGKNILGHPSLIMILLHESVHSKEKHFYDIITAELLLSLQWFNPFAWLHRDAIRNNLEFQADDIVIRESDAEEYQLTMLSMVQNRIKPPLFAELNSSNLKKRIIMMKSENLTRFSGIARFAVIPVIAMLLLSLSGKETIIIQDHARENSELITQEQRLSDLKDFKITIENTDKGLKMHSSKGSVWINLRFDFPNDIPQAINQYGMTQLDKESSNKDPKFADYLFIITKTQEGVKLIGITGTAWKELSFTLPKNGKQTIDQFGMTE